MLKYCMLFVSCLCLLILASCTDESGSPEKNTTELFVSAAASLSQALDEIGKTFEEENPNIHLTLNFAGSGKLAQQIQQGAPVDVFLSANEDWMDTLQKDGLLDKQTRVEFAKNRLVMIGKKDANLQINEFSDIHSKIGQIAIGNPKSVPAGEYAKEALVHLGKWDELRDRNQFVYAKDVTQVLTYVESGNTAIGFVYQSDVLRSDKVNILAKANTNWHSPIVYPGAVIKTSKHRNAAIKFLNYLQTDRAQVILSDHGFTN